MSSVNIESDLYYVVVILIYYLFNLVYHLSAVMAIYTKQKIPKTKLEIVKWK
jgi:hypothetical protein